MTHAFATTRSGTSRGLGLIGIVGGIALLTAFLVDIPTDANVVRIVLYNLGGIAVIVAVHRRQVSMSPMIAWVVAVVAVLANALLAAREILPYGPWHPFVGTGLTYFNLGIAMWLTDAAFGLVTLRLAVVTRLGALVLTIGSVLALTGVDGLGLTSGAAPTVFGPISLIGIALNGIGWILLGFDVATRPRSALPEATA